MRFRTRASIKERGNEKRRKLRQVVKRGRGKGTGSRRGRRRDRERGKRRDRRRGRGQKMKRWKEQVP